MTRHLPKTLLFSQAISVLSIGMGLITASPAGAASFRVNPYLQQPSSDGMYLTWFTEENVIGTLSVSGPGLDSPLTLTSTPTFEPLLSYTAAEKNQEIAGLEPESWLLGDTSSRSLWFGFERVETVQTQLKKWGG